MSLSNAIADPIAESLHKKRQYYVEESLREFKAKYGYEDPKLRQKLEAEAERIYPMVDQSIVKERVQRGLATFFITLGLATAVLFLWPLAVPGLLAVGIPTAVLSVIPLIWSAAIAAIATVAT